jgi:hypothetical protein
MFKIGEKVVCINSGESPFENRPNMINGKIYVVRKYFDLVSVYGEKKEQDYFAWRFQSLKDQRKEKIQKLNFQND